MAQSSIFPFARPASPHPAVAKLHCIQDASTTSVSTPSSANFLIVLMISYSTYWTSFLETPFIPILCKGWRRRESNPPQTSSPKPLTSKIYSMKKQKNISIRLTRDQAISESPSPGADQRATNWYILCVSLWKFEVTKFTRRISSNNLNWFC